MSRPAVAHICLDALRHNYGLAKKMHGGRALAVIKANAYGHGAVQCAHALAGEADGYAVAAIEEALALREAGIVSPVLLLEGFFEIAELPEIVANNLWIVVHAAWQVAALMQVKLARPLTVWLKMDTGMHRVGLTADCYRATYEQLQTHPNVEHIVLMTHFARADELCVNDTMQQIALFRSTIKGIHAPLSLSNSAGILGWPAANADWARPGIMLYGVDPLLKREDIFAPLAAECVRPVMQLVSTVIAVRTVACGDAVGYGGVFVANRITRVGVVACGYADGYPRAAPMGTPVVVDGKLTRLIGRVSMDMLMVDLTDLPASGLGSRVELWGDQVAVSEIAGCAGTIAYELLCNVKRVRFVYTDTSTEESL
ncbi:MAG: alanine racemase [Sulfuriferula sp.]